MLPRGISKSSKVKLPVGFVLSTLSFQATTRSALKSSTNKIDTYSTNLGISKFNPSSRQIQNHMYFEISEIQAE